MERINKRPFRDLSPVIEVCENLDCPCRSGRNGVFNREHQLLAFLQDQRLLFRHALNSIGLYRQPDGIRLACGHDGSYFGLYIEDWVKKETAMRYAIELENTFNDNFDKMIFQFVRDFECCRDKALRKL